MNPARPLPSNRRLTPRENPRVATPVRTPAPVAQKTWDPDALWRNLRLVGRVLLGVSVVAIGIAAAVWARTYVTHSPRFALKDLKLEGAKHRTPEQILAAAGLALGQNVVDLDLDAMRGRIEADPWIERAIIVRRLPATVSIEVVERDAAAIVALPSGTWLATSQGELFKRLEDGDPNDLPVVTGIRELEAVSDRETTAQLVRKALDLAADVERVGLFGGRVQELNVDAGGGIAAVLSKRTDGRGLVRVVFGATSHRRKVRLAQKIEQELVRRGARPTVIFLDDDVHPDRVVVRLVSALPPATVTVDDGPSAKAGGKS